MVEREERRGDAPWGKEAASLKAGESRGYLGRPVWALQRPSDRGAAHHPAAGLRGLFHVRSPGEQTIPKTAEALHALGVP